MKTLLQRRYTGYYTGRVLWSKEQRWGDLLFGSSSSSLAAGAEGGAFRKNHKLYVTVGGATSRTVVSTDGAPRYEGPDVVGHVSFIPAERQNQGWYKGELLECLSLELPPNWIEKCLDGRDLSTVEFLSVTNRFDPLIFNAMAALREETEIGGPAGRLFAETAATLIALHLIRQYSNVGATIAHRNRQEIGQNHFERAIEFMEANLGSELTLDALAEVADLPVSTFVHAFAVQQECRHTNTSYTAGSNAPSSCSGLPTSQSRKLPINSASPARATFPLSSALGLENRPPGFDGGSEASNLSQICNCCWKLKDARACTRSK